jgi:hypothetical protein
LFWIPFLLSNCVAADNINIELKLLTGLSAAYHSEPFPGGNFTLRAQQQKRNPIFSYATTTQFLVLPFSLVFLFSAHVR